MNRLAVGIAWIALASLAVGCGNTEEGTLTASGGAVTRTTTATDTGTETDTAAGTETETETETETDTEATTDASGSDSDTVDTTTEDPTTGMPTTGMPTTDDPTTGMPTTGMPTTDGASCGDGNVDMTEQCDGMNLNGMTCQSLGYDTGNLACDPITCTYDTSGCMSNPTTG